MDFRFKHETWTEDRPRWEKFNQDAISEQSSEFKEVKSFCARIYEYLPTKWYGIWVCNFRLKKYKELNQA